MREEIRKQARAMWALGDYSKFAQATVWEVGPLVVEACGIAPGMRVLDVAAGTGNVAIRAAKAGAKVTASDITPENFAAGRALAREAGVELAWVEADAEALPFDDGEFDVVTSAFGVMFAPDHQRAAGELLRVCKPGGTIGLASFTPTGLAAAFFDVLAPYMPPPPPGAGAPLAWGSEPYLRGLFGERVATLVASKRTYVERAASPEAYYELFTDTFGPVIAIQSSLAATPDRRAAFDRAFLDFATRANRAAPGRPAEFPYEYLLAVIRTRT